MRVLITGAACGIGAETARQLAWRVAAALGWAFGAHSMGLVLTERERRAAR